MISCLSRSENVRKIRDLYKYDCLRANKSTMAWGVEARVPFLDKVGRAHPHQCR